MMMMRLTGCSAAVAAATMAARTTFADALHPPSAPLTKAEPFAVHAGPSKAGAGAGAGASSNEEELVAKVVHALDKYGLCKVTGLVPTHVLEKHLASDAFQDGTDTIGKRRECFIQGTPGRWHRIRFTDADAEDLHTSEAYWMSFVNGFFAGSGARSSNINGSSSSSGEAGAAEVHDGNSTILVGGSSGNSVKGRDRPSRTQRQDLRHQASSSSTTTSTAIEPVRTQMQLLVSIAQSKDQFFHQDNARRGLTVLLPLVDVSKELGPTELLTGTHLLTEATTAPAIYGVIKEAASEVMAVWDGAFKTVGYVAPELERGDLLIYDSRTLHRGLGNMAGSARPVVIYRYDAPHTHPAETHGLVSTFVFRHIGNIFHFLGHAWDERNVR